MLPSHSETHCSIDLKETSHREKPSLPKAAFSSIAVDELCEACGSHAAVGGSLEGAELRPCCGRVVSEIDRVRGLGTPAVVYPNHPGTSWQGCQAWPGLQEIVTPSPEPCRARAVIHIMTGELGRPRQVLRPCAETPVLKCSSDAGPCPACELREPLLLLLPK